MSENNNLSFSYTIGDTDLIVLKNIEYLSSYLKAVRDILVSKVLSGKKHSEKEKICYNLVQEIDLFLRSIIRLMEVFKDVSVIYLYPDANRVCKINRLSKDFYCIRFRRADGVCRLHIEIKKGYVLGRLLTQIVYGKSEFVKPNEVREDLDVFLQMEVRPHQYRLDPTDNIINGILEILRYKNKK